MNIPFSSQLTTLRTSAKLTNRELARLADVPESTIAGLQSGNRRVGEIQARKLGLALQLKNETLEQFVLHAIDTCTEKVLCESKHYPAELLNLIARQLRKAGIVAESICNYDISGDERKQNVTLTLGSGKSATLTTHLQYA